MKVDFTDFNPNAILKDRYEYGIDYILHNFDLNFEDTYYLVKQLKHNTNSVVVYAESIADFHLFDEALHVQIDGQGFWFAENIDLEIAGKILKAVFEGCEYFGQYILETKKEWEAWTP